MKKVLITGSGSYIGSSLKNRLSKDTSYNVLELDVKGEAWKAFDFHNFDVIFHVAGIAHIKETEENKDLYTKVNRDLTIEIAKKAKSAGVSHFIFMSSMSVYGLSDYETEITENTDVNPLSSYAKSKYEAEVLLNEMKDESFCVSILRPPMVYGKESPGNMTKLLNLVRKVHVFPTYKNQRSYITIETLISNVEAIIDKQIKGLFLLQEDHYLCTYEFLKDIMNEEQRKLMGICLFNPIIHILVKRNSTCKKVFGNLKYTYIDYFERKESE